MKTKTLLIAAVLFFGISVAAFAQTAGQIATYTVGYVPVPTVVQSGRTEKAGDITFTTISETGPTVTGTITVNYSLPVTYNGTIIVIPGSVGTPPTFGTPTLDATKKKLTFSITPANNVVAKYGFVLTGVRLDVVGSGTPLTAFIETTGNAIVSGESIVQVITSSDHGLKQNGFTIAPGAVFNTLGVNVSGGSATFSIVEGFPYAFWKTIADDPTQNNTQLIKIALNETLPAGVTITFPATDSSGKWALSDYTGTAAGASQMTSTNNKIYYKLVQSSDTIAIETVVLNGVTVAVTQTAFPTYVPATYTAYATLGVVETDFSPINTSTIPRYVTDAVNASVPVLTIQAAAINTVMLIPYATTEQGYDTGIAIANTTKDPLATAATAFPQSGKIVFYCYNNDGTLITISTADAAVKAVLDSEAENAWFPLTASGQLESGKSYAVVLSQLLRAKGADPDFHGYIIVITDFTNAHGEYFLTNWNFFTHGSLMLVVSAPSRSTVPEALNN